ncbi:MAG: bacterioferritin [Thermodesulfobacteriota bacterium]
MDKNERDSRKKKVIEVLNKARSLELRAIHQYMVQHYNLDALDYGEMAVNLKLIGIDEMRHAEVFADRVKQLGGEPTTDLAGKVEKGQTVEKAFSFDAALEDNAIAEYNRFAAVCRENGDAISMKLFETIIEDEQAHLDYFDNVTDHIKNLGQVYLAQIAGTPSSTGLAHQGFVIRQAGGGTPKVV